MTLTSDRRAGFALPAVLTVTGVVTLVFMVAITALASLTAEAASARARIGFLQRALTLEATVAYLAVTEPFTPNAIAVGFPRNYDDQYVSAPVGGFATSASPAQVLLDGETYATDLRGPMTLTLRDQAGMLNLPQLNPDQLDKLGERLGMGRSERQGLGPRLMDYTDTDDLENQNGGERASYGASGPANRPFLRPSELLSVLGIREATSAPRWRALREDIAADQSQRIYNINTASAATLEVWFGLTAEQADRAIARRRDVPFASVSSFGAAAGAALVDDGEILYTFPSGRILFTLSDGRSPWVYRGRLTITPTHAEQPVWLDQTDIMESARRTVADTTNATSFPYAVR